MHSVVSDYLEAIYTLRAEGEDVFGVTLADLFGVSRANASATLQRLVRDGLVQVEGRQVELTATGREGAEAGIKRHRITERFLLDVLGIDWAELHEEARQFERGLTPLLEERVDARVGFPRTCPHGNPIPRADLDAGHYLRDKQALRLSAAPLDTAMTLLLFSEVVEDRVELLRGSAAQGLYPGVLLTVTERDAAAEALLIRVSGEPFPLEWALATRIWVVQESAEGAVQ